MSSLPSKSFELLFEQIGPRIRLLKYSSIVIYVGLLINFIFSISYVFNASQINHSSINVYFILLIFICLIYIYLINNALGFVCRWQSVYSNVDLIYSRDFSEVDTYNLIKTLNSNIEFKKNDIIRILLTFFFIFLLINRNLPLDFSLMNLLERVHIERDLVVLGFISFILLNVVIEFPFVLLMFDIAPKIKSLLKVESEEPLNLS